MKYIIKKQSFLLEHRFNKTYENIKKSEPNIGDYVIINFNYYDEIWADYINNQIGKIISKYGGRYQAIYNINDYIYKEYFEKRSDTQSIINKGNKKYFIMYCDNYEILYFSKYKKDCEMFLAAKKYNL